MDRSGRRRCKSEPRSSTSISRSTIVDNHTLLPLAIPISLQPDGRLTLACALWEQAALPSSYIPIDSHHALQTHVAPPHRPVLGEDDQAMESVVEGSSFNYDPTSSPRPPSLASGPHSSSPPRGAGQGEASPPRKRPRLTMSNSVRSGSNRPFHAGTTPSAGQRSSKSRRSLTFWRAIGGSFEFELQPLLIRNLSHKLDKEYLAVRPNRDPLFLSRYTQYLIQDENRHSTFTHVGKNAMRSGDVFSTYKDRKDVWVQLHSVDDGEEGSTAASFAGICGLSNLFASFPDNFRAGVDNNARYKYAPRLDCGVTDLASRPNPDPDRHGSQVSHPSRLLIERKVKLTHRDVLVLMYVLGQGVVKVSVDDKGAITVIKPAEGSMLSAAVKSILVQLAHQFLTNQAEYVALATHDVWIIFRLLDKTRAQVSKILFRDPETFIPMFSDHQFLARSLARVDNRRAIIKDIRQSKDIYFETGCTLLKILVAGLVVGMDTTSSIWLSSDAIRTGFTTEYEENAGRHHDAEAKGNSSKSTSRPLSGAQQEHPAAEGDGSASFSLSVHPASFAAIDGVQQADTTQHYLPISSLSLFVWTPHPNLPARLRLSTDSDSVSSELSGPSLTTASTASSDTQDLPHSPKLDNTPADRARVPNDTENGELDNLHKVSGNGAQSAASTPDHLDRLGLPLTPLPSLKSSAHRHHVTATINEYIGSGRLWDVYRALLRYDGQPARPVVLKLCNPATYDGPDQIAEAHRRVANEMTLLSKPLAALQGLVVPHLLHAWWGKWTLGPGRWAAFDCMVLEDCGRPVADESSAASLPPERRAAVLRAYRRLHRAGVIHHDVSWRHILCHPQDGKPRLVDFEGSEYVGSPDTEREVDTRRAMQSEMDYVCEMLQISEMHRGV